MDVAQWSGVPSPPRSSRSTASSSPQILLRAFCGVVLAACASTGFGLDRAQAVVYGSLALRQTFCADLDSGTIAIEGCDLWFEADTPTDRFLTPVGGSEISSVANVEHKLGGCTAAPLSSNRVAIEALGEGSFVCVRTDAGRLAELFVTRAPGAAPTGDPPPPVEAFPALEFDYVVFQ